MGKLLKRLGGKSYVLQATAWPINMAEENKISTKRYESNHVKIEGTKYTIGLLFNILRKG